MQSADAVLETIKVAAESKAATARRKVKETTDAAFARGADDGVGEAIGVEVAGQHAAGGRDRHQPELGLRRAEVTGLILEKGEERQGQRECAPGDPPGREGTHLHGVLGVFRGRAGQSR